MENSAIFEEITKLVNSQRQKLTDNALLVSQLEAKCESLAESLRESEARQAQCIPASVHETQIAELQAALQRAKDELKHIEDFMAGDIDSNNTELNREMSYFVSMNKIDNGSASQYCGYTLEFPENAELTERQVTKLKNQLSRFEEELSRVSGRSEADQLMASHEKKTLNKMLQLASEKQKKTDAAHSIEVAGLQKQILQAEDERNKAIEELAMLRASPRVYARYREETQRKELLDSQREMQELQEKYEQLAIYADNLREEKTIIQAKRDEALLQHSETLKKCEALEMEVDELKEEREKDNLYFEGKLLAMADKLDVVQEELQDAWLAAAALDDFFLEPETLKLPELLDKVDILHSQLDAFTQEICSRNKATEDLRLDLQAALKAKETVQLELEIKLQEAEELMATQADQFKAEIAVMDATTNALQLKVELLQGQKAKLEAEATLLRTQLAHLEKAKTRVESELNYKEVAIQLQLKPISQEMETNVKNIGNLNSACGNLCTNLLVKSNSFVQEQLRFESVLTNLTREKELLEERITALDEQRQRDFKKSNLKLQIKTKRFLKEKRGLRIDLKTLTTKNESLEKTMSELKLENDRNVDLQAKLTAKEAETESLRETCITQRVEAANLEEHKGELKAKIEKLRTTLKEKESSVLTEKNSMNDTIMCLLHTKRTLEEEQCTMYERIEKLEHEIAALKAVNLNRSSHSTGDGPAAPPQGSVKPLSPNNTTPTRPSADAGFIKKSSQIVNAARSEKRKTAHDENRMQSWSDTRDCGTMTDPLDNLLTIARNMVLMENPSKAENAQEFKTLSKPPTMAQRRLRRLRHRTIISPIGPKSPNKPQKAIDSPK